MTASETRQQAPQAPHSDIEASTKSLIHRLISSRFLLVFGLFFIIASGVIFYFLFNNFNAFKNSPVSLPKEGITYVLKKGMGFARFSHDLHEKGVVSSLNYFRWLGKQQDKDLRIQAGEYFFSSGMTPVALLDKVQKGKVIQHSFTIIDGWNFKTLRHALQQRSDIRQTLGPQDSPEEVAASLALKHVNPEGLFLPETYFFTLGMSDRDILQRAAASAMKVLQEKWAEREQGLLLDSPYEALIFASLIEKETGQAIERKIISGVFHRRLKKRMRLETDPTVIYGLGDAYQGNIKRKHLRTDTPYNTYTRHGLPPTPIAMVGIEAIDAALHPAKGEALYFVAKGDGSHVFSRNYADHLKAVRRYQLKKRHGK